MLVNSLFYQFREYINSEEVKEVFDFICHRGYISTFYNFKIRYQGKIKTLRFLSKKSGAYELGVIVNVSSLLFYFRNPFFKAHNIDRSSILQKIQSSKPNASGEITISIFGKNDIALISGLVPDFIVKQGGPMSNENKTEEDNEELKASIDRIDLSVEGYSMGENETAEHSNENVADDEEDVEYDGDIKWVRQDLTAYQLHRNYSRGELILNPDFQRHYVWNAKLASRFIESILMNLPIPTIFLSESGDGSFEVVDGQQRLKTVFDFLNNELSLKNIGSRQYLELNGKKFRDLDNRLQSRVENYCFNIIKLRCDASENLKFNMFERLNQGAIKLNRQELRNCIYRGNFNNLLRKIAADDRFIKACGWKESNARMDGEEMILRFFAFRDTNIETVTTYDGLLNASMIAKKSSDEKELNKMSDLFFTTLNIVNSVFGDRKFKIFSSGQTEGDVHGHWMSAMNKVVFELQMVTLSLHDPNKVMRHKDAIRESFISLLCNDQEMLNSLRFGTNSSRSMKKRHKTWRRELDEIFASDVQQRRLFSVEEKRVLFERNPTCSICGMSIVNIDDAAVDHIVHYWRGGLTNLENARITHRHCNLVRGGRE